VIPGSKDMNIKPKKSEGNKLKNINRKTVFLFIMLIILSACGIASTSTSKTLSQADCDSMEVLKQYSLFSEYHKNKDFESALPFGWFVLECDPVRFNKWIYYKMEDCLWYLHDSAGVAPEAVSEIEDTILYFYNLALENFVDGKGYFQPRKAFVMESWLDMQPEEVISEYEKAIETHPDISSYYYNRLGQLYVNEMNGENGYKMKAIDIYTTLAEREPENPEWPRILSTLVDDIGQLLDIRKRNWELDKDNLEKAWTYAAESIRAQDFERAIEPLRFLTEKAPETINYWNQLASAYQKLNRLNDAEDAYNKLIALDPDNKDHYLNLAIIYKEQGKLSRARQYFQIASDKGNGWALPIFYEGNLYEQAARGCEFNFEAKMVYQLAVDTYRKAYRMDASLTQARDRANALSGSVPTQEDYFFRGYKSGQVLPISGDCYGWIGRSITVP
jgi:tetratricopeptide (TPR) repeat protein